MTEQDEIDIRRAKALADLAFCEHRDRLIRDGYELAKNHEQVRLDVIEREWPNHTAAARAIRLSDESAGYITAKLEGVVNEKDRKG